MTTTLAAPPSRTMTPEKVALRAAVRALYDVQYLRIGQGNRTALRGPDAPDIELTQADVDYNEASSKHYESIEAFHLKRIKSLLPLFPISGWLLAQPGIAENMAGFLLSEFDIEIAERPSQFWAFAGLGVKDGHSPHPTKGEKLPYNSRLRSKCIAVIGGGFLKAGEQIGTGIMVERTRKGGEVVTVEKKKALGHPIYRALYDGARHRKATDLGPCVLCGGTGKAAQPKKDEDGKVSADAGKKKKCWNCVAPKAPTHPAEAGGPWTPECAPWGRGSAHRHAHAVRVMVKAFLADFWRAWRIAEDLPVVGTYHEEKQNYKHRRKDLA